MDTTKPPDIGFGVRVLFVLLGGAKAIFDLYARNEKYYFDDFVSFKILFLCDPKHKLLLNTY